MGVLDVFRRKRGEEERAADGISLSIDDWMGFFQYGGLAYQIGLNQTLGGSKAEEVIPSFAGLAQGAYKRSGIVFAVEMTRVMHFSEARFVYRDISKGRPGKLFGTADLKILEQPWPGATTGDLLSKMLVHADLAGNAFVTRQGNRLKILRPDWMTIVIGSMTNPDSGAWYPDAELLGYIYHPGGYHSDANALFYAPSEIAHFAPIPDPEAEFRGMSWLQPVIKDVMGDQAATEHKLKFFENGATPNIIATIPITDPAKFETWVKLFREKYEGSANAYKTMFLASGADTKVVGATFQQMDFKATVGVSETRIAAAAGVPAVVVGLSEGLQGSSLNAGNYNAARRRFADGTMRPLWRNIAGSLSKLVPIPGGAQLWYDTRDIAFLREDEEVEANITSVRAQALRTLIDGGVDFETAKNAVISGDFSDLTHSGLLSVQLQEPGNTKPASDGNGAGPDPKADPGTSGDEPSNV